MLIDVHAHLDFPQFNSDRDKIIEEARREDIIIINSGIGPSGIKKTLELSRKYDNVYATLGLSPQEFDEGIIEETISLIRKHRRDIVGVGEVGLDYHWVKEPQKRQAEKINFDRFINLSKELSLPVVIHSRDAESDVIEKIEEENFQAILHSFGGTVDEAERAVSSGALISIPASICYSKQKMRLVREIPLESTVLETDSPYLSPEPKTRNTPLNLKLSAEKIAEIKEVDVGIIEEVTAENAKKFFNLRI